MRNLLTLLAGAIALATYFSCQPAKREVVNGLPVVLEIRTIRQAKGQDCDKPDSLRSDCAIIDFSTPAIQGAAAQNAPAKSLNAWTDAFLIRLLTWTDYPELDASKAQPTVAAAIQRFRAIHDEAAGSVSAGQFIATCTNGILLNDGKYLTVRLKGHSFQGGNRALDETAIATFDCATGKKLGWDDLVQDKSSLLPLAEAYIRETRAAAFEEGFVFDKMELLSLPDAYGLTGRGIVFHYQSEEILHLGGATEFVAPFDALGANLKVTAPVVAAAETSDLYTVEGDSMVIPTFEIEIRTSAKAGRTLRTKKETVIVSAFFSGDPIDDKDRDDDGLMAISQATQELAGNTRVARFENLKFSRAAFNKLKDKDIELLINVYSGRKSSDDNLLSCSILHIKASQFGNKRFSLGCSLIEEDAGSGYTPPVACFVLPEAGADPAKPPAFLVECNERGDMDWAGEPLRDYADLKVKLRPILEEYVKNGSKNLPGLEVRGCMMGSGGELRSAYDELKTEVLKRGKTPTTKSAGTGSAQSAAKTAKSATATPKTPAVAVYQSGKITLNGKNVETFEDLRKQLQQDLLGYAVIPNDVPVKFVGTVGMGARAEMRSVVAESVAGAKWIRKKTALAALAGPVGKKLGTAVQLELNDYQTSGAFAFIDARPKQTNGKPVDYGKTVYQQELAAGKFADRVLGLLQYRNGTWNMLIYTIGTNSIPVEVWVKKYKAPKSLFGKLK